MELHVEPRLQLSLNCLTMVVLFVLIFDAEVGQQIFDLMALSSDFEVTKAGLGNVFVLGLGIQYLADGIMVSVDAEICCNFHRSLSDLLGVELIIVDHATGSGRRVEASRADGDDTVLYFNAVSRTIKQDGHL